MIDVEHIVFSKVYSAIHTEYPNAQITSEPVEKLAVFPAIVIEEIDNRTYKKSLDEAGNEHHATLTYEINVYSNKQNGNKLEAKDIMQIADTVMQSLYATREVTTAIPMVDRTIYRLYARYKVIVDEGETTGDDTTYYCYRK